MYEVDMRFERSDVGIKEKVHLMARIHNVPDEVVWNEYYKISNMQMTELRIWQFINSCLYKEKGVI